MSACHTCTAPTPGLICAPCLASLASPAASRLLSRRWPIRRRSSVRLAAFVWFFSALAGVAAGLAVATPPESAPEPAPNTSEPVISDPSVLKRMLEADGGSDPLLRGLLQILLGDRENGVWTLHLAAEHSPRPELDLWILALGEEEFEWEPTWTNDSWATWVVAFLRGHTTFDQLLAEASVGPHRRSRFAPGENRSPALLWQPLGSWHLWARSSRH